VKFLASSILYVVVAAYTMAKYGMSQCALGMAEEFRDDGVAVNTLWPRTGNNMSPATTKW